MKSHPFDCVVLVLGMHRSGTSALAGVLARCGLGLPKHMLAPGEANERGFFESARINELNNRILSDFGRPWLDLEPIAEKCWRPEETARRKDEIMTLVAEEFAPAATPVIKDPRICRLLPLWKQALNNIAKDIRVAFIIRPPTEVALSLADRNQMEIEAGLLLWARYNLDAEHHSRNLPRRFIGFSELLADWRAALQKLDLPIDPAAIDGTEIDGFLSGSLQHHHDSGAQPTNVHLADQLFGILTRWARDGESQKDYSQLDELRAKFDDMSLVLNELSEKGRLERKRRTNLAARSAAAEAQLASREEQLGEVVDTAKRSLREIERRSEAFSQQAQRMGEEFAHAMRLVGEKDSALRALAEEKIEAVRSLTAEKVEAVRAVTAEKEEIQRALAAQKEQVEVVLARSSALSSELSVAQATADQAETELRLVKKKYCSTQLILQRERDRAQKLEAQITQALARIRELESSVAFRLTKALNSLGSKIESILSFRGQRASKRQRERSLIRESEFFDASWYLDAYPDVAAARIDPAVHFADIGWREGRNPSSAFCTTRYLRRYPDVAELSINPLIHFLEHGFFEGREVQGVGELPARPGHERRSQRVALPPAMPIYAGHVEPRPLAAWHRACQLVDDAQAIIIDGLGVTTIASAQLRTAFEAFVADFERLSGRSGEPGPELGQIANLPDIQDGWFATSHRLITRWKVDQPAVIRALQVDPLTESPVFAGEGLATGVIDPIAFDLSSPTMPVMFIASTCDGELIGARTMAFPSLLRGGLHYPELVAAGHRSGLGAMEYSAGLERQLRLLRAGNSKPAVRAIEVDLAGADGTGPLFRRDLRDLLGRVLMVDVNSSSNLETGRDLYLSEAVQIFANRPCRRDGGKLKLAGDMVPALAILVSSSSQSRPGDRDFPMSLIVSDIDPSQPAVRFDPPVIKSALGKIRSGSYPVSFPRLSGGDPKSQLAAVRRVYRSLDDAEYLMPDMSSTAGKKASDVSIDWLVDPNRWDEALLSQSIQALALQEEVGRQRLLFTRPPSEFIQDVARSSLGSEPAVFEDLDSALAGCIASIVGYLSAGIILHDPRTAAILSSLLLDSAVSTASCVVVASARHGKSWRTRLVDGGVFPVDRRVVFGPRTNSPTEMLWRATYPTTEPTRLWLARPDDVRHWRSGDHVGKELHLVTSVISASLEGEPQAEINELAVAPARENRSISAKVLVG